MYNSLFSPIQLNGLTLKNRVVFPAMGSRFCTDDGYVLDTLVDYHAARAKGGCGLNITEAVAVYKPGAVFRMLQISDDSYIPGLKKLTDAIHENGGKACIQLWQAGMAAAGTPGAEIIFPSDLPLGPGKVIPAASKETIAKVVSDFGKAARRAVEAGFDAIEYHAAHNYSPHAFLSPAMNHRTDEYGGTPENRARYLLECIRAIRSNIPADMPLIMRISAQDDELKNGLSREDIIQFCTWAHEAGVDVLDVSRGNLMSAAMRYEVPSLDNARGFNVDNADAIRKATGIPTIGVGRINDPEQANGYIENDQVDMVVIGRGQIADPNFCNKCESGHVEDLIRCVGCNQGCYDNCVMGNPITCMRNPSVGKEALYAALEKNADPKRLLVVGGGVGGMEAAGLAKALGHDVTLAEASDHLGGQFLLAGVAPRKAEMAVATKQKAEQIERAGVNIVLNQPVDAAYLDQADPQALVIAIGASPSVPPIDGVYASNVMQAHDVLKETALPKGKVAIIGGGLVGLEAAEYLEAKGHDVTVLEMQDKIAKDVGPGRATDINLAIALSGIETIVNAKCTKIDEAGVHVQIGEEEKIIPADTVVLATGSKSNDASLLTDWAKEHNVPYALIGDAKQARRALQAIHEGAQAVLDLLNE
jgi:2,4-dienoyl-CoA reductase-like NADH-dependent reductase (Old Yellow Enzyme family)/thioredoxin reductase